MTNTHPIAALLGLAAGREDILINGEAFQLMGGSNGTCETLYRANPGHGVSNPGFTLGLTRPTHHKMQLGNYLAGRPGVKRAQAEALVDNALVQIAEGVGA